MAELKPSEKRLLIGMGTVLFLAANFFAWSFLNEKEIKVSGEEQKLRADLATNRALAAQLPLAQKREALLAKVVKAYPNITMRDTYLADFVKENADALGLKLSKQVPTRLEGLDKDEDQTFIKSGYTAEVSGDRKAVIEFIHRLHHPSEARLVKSLNLSVRKGDAQDGQSELACNFEIQKWWNAASEKDRPEAAEAPPEVTSNPATEQKSTNEVRPSGATPAPASSAAAPGAEATPTVGTAKPNDPNLPKLPNP